MLLEARAILPPLRSPAGEYEYVPDDITEGMSGREATEEERSGEKDPRFTPRIVVVPTPADQEDGEKEESSPSASPTAGAGDHATPEDNTSDGEPGDGEKNKPGRHTDDASSRSKHAAAAHPAESADGADGDTEPGESGETGEGAADDESTDGAVEIAGIPDDGGAGDAEESEGGDDAPAGTGKAEREGTDAAAEADSSVDTADEGTLEDKNNTAAGAPEPKSGQDAPDGAPGSDLASGERSDADGGDSTSTEGVDPAEEDAPGGNANGSAVDGEEDDSAAAWADLAGDLSDDSHAHGVSAEGVVDVGDKDMVAVDENYKDGVSGATLHGEVRSLTNEEVEDLISRLGDDALTEESLALGEPPAEPQPALDDGPDYRAMETEMKRSDIHAGVRLAVYDAVPQPALYQDCMSKTARIREELYVKLRPLVVRQRSEQFSGRRSGSLHASRLWRVNAIYDPHVFQNRTMPYDPALAAYLLADASGSMSAKETFGSLDCSRADAVRYTMAALSDVLERLAIVHAASDFDESSTVNHRRLLKFGQKTGRESVVDYGHRLNNRDGYNIRIATAELKRRPERVKVLFVLSDGQPLASDYAGVAAVADTGRAVQEAKAQGIEVVAFYFGPRTVDSLAQERKMFTMANLIVVNDMGRLPLDIAAVLQRIVRRYRVA